MVVSHTVEVIVVMGFVISTVCPLKIKQCANDFRADLCPMGVNYHQWPLSLAATRSLLSSIEQSSPNYVDLWSASVAVRWQQHRVTAGAYQTDELVTRCLVSLHDVICSVMYNYSSKQCGQTGEQTVFCHSFLKL